MIGTVLGGKYRVDGVLAEGGTAVVYRATRLSDRKPVAVKLLQSNLDAHEELRRRLLRETRVLSAVHHDNIVRALDHGETTDGSPYLVLEFITGRTLARIVDEDGPLSWQRALPLFAQVCEALEYLHGQGIVDRDLSPTNIMLAEPDGDYGETIKVIDLGILKYSDGDAGSGRLTITGDIIGNPMYMSPEQAIGEPADARSDVYSIGTIMWEALAGRPMFAGKNVAEIISKHAYSPAPRIDNAAPSAGLPQSVARTVMRCLEKDPAARFQTVAELRQSLQSASKGHGSITPTPSSQQTVRDLVWAAVAIAGAAAGLCLLFVHFAGR